jgi:hypothetical protein
MIARWRFMLVTHIVRWSWYRVGDPHSTDFPPPFSLLLYDFFFIPSPFKPCGYCICLIMMRHVPFSPNLYTTWHILHLRDLRKWRKIFFPSAGDGSTTTNIKMNTNGYVTRVILTQPLHHCTILTQPLHHRMTVLRNVPRDLQAWRTCKLAGPSAGWTIQW